MGFINKYPYTDMHELNLDWFLQQFADYVSGFDEFRAEITAEWEEYKQTLNGEWQDVEDEWTAVQQAWTALYDYVHDYFDNLDVQDEVDAKLDEMATDGTLSALLGPIVQPFLNQYAQDVTDLQTDVAGLGTVVSGAWIATTVAAIGAQLTNDITLSKGTWIIVVASPIIAGTANYPVMLESMSGTTSLTNDNKFSMLNSELRASYIITVTSTTAALRLRYGSSTSETFSYTERGGIYAVKVSA